VQLHDLLAGLAGFGGAGVLELRPEPAPPTEVKSVVHDSRDARPGALFCCIRGAVADGHAFAPEAVLAGASALLVEEWVPVDVPQARVGSVRSVLGPVAARFHGEPSFAMRVLGITGTNGKTTVTYLLESIATAAGDVAGVIGTVAARVGDEVLSVAHTTPEATELQSVLATMRDDGVGTVAMEVSSHALDQHRVDATNFAATCFINLSHDHLDYHGSVDAYFEAKARLFAPVFTQRAAVNVNDPYGRKLARRAAANGLVVTRFAIGDSPPGEPAADVRAQRIELSPTGTTFELVTCAGKPVRVRTALVGSFNVVNALAAATTALLAGFELEAIVAGLERPIVVPGRLERVDAGQDFTVLVDYAHTPDALQSVLGAARELVRPGARLISVFGCGGDRDREKRPMMGEIAARLSDRAYVTTDNPRSEDPEAIVNDILVGVPQGSPVETILDRRAAIREAVAGARPGDVVVVAGKGHESGQIIGDRIEPFDDRVVTRAELEARAS
jgi:UDP-N-acetylmuramoyl-L-alanyl-D-glutamate--2,6-diaminopimelate ligase